MTVCSHKKQLKLTERPKTSLTRIQQNVKQKYDTAVPISEKLMLVKDGVAKFCIEVRPSQDAETVFPVLDELTSHLERCLGTSDIEWFNRWSDDNPPIRLVVHFAPESGLDRQTFEIISSQNEIILRAGTIMSLNNAVYTLLSEAFGIRWLWPGKTGTVTPHAENVFWPLGTKRYTPDWKWRRLWIGGAFWKEDDATLAELKIGVRCDTLKELHCWQQRNRLGGLNIADGHRWGQICSPLVYGKTHPEYFALVNGKRDTIYYDGKHENQPCTSNPEVLKLAADYIIAQFYARPELDGFSFAVNDGRGFCECDMCRAQDISNAKKVGSDFFDTVTNEAAPGYAPGLRVITDRMLKFANSVAERVTKVFPDKVLLFLIYGPYRQPPKRTYLHQNVIAQFCAMSWSHSYPNHFENDMHALRGLTGYAEQLGIYDYFVNGRNGNMPRGFARTFHRSLQYYHQHGFRYFASQAGLDFAINGFSYYVAAQALWNSKIPFETLMDDYCRVGFGPAAKYIKQYLNAFLERWEETKGGRIFGISQMEQLTPHLYSSEWRLLRRLDLENAINTDHLSDEQTARIHFIIKGMDYLDLLCEACISTNRLIEDGAPTGADATPERIAEWNQKPGHHVAVQAALRDRRQLLDWMKHHKNGFYISTMWAEYQRLMVGGILGKWLDLFQKE
jgi:hypothetical protein